MTAPGRPDYIRTGMGKSLAMRILSAVALGALLVHLSPVATGMLLCVGDEAVDDCCGPPQDSQSRVSEAKRLLDGSGCSCCITVDAAPATAGRASHKASLDILFGSGLSRNAVLPAGARVSRAGGPDPGDSRLSSLRTVVLLI